jgi:acyl-coenzyme A synthetase/AMP-(fatty) acid ligase
MLYGDLAVAVAQAAQLFEQAAGGVRDRAVGLVLSDPAALLVSLLGALESGAVPVVVDPRGGEALIQRQLDDARPAVVVRAVAAEDRLELVEGHPDPRVVAPEVALLLFTSGSTTGSLGTRAVQLGGRGLKQHLDCVVQSLGLGPSDRVPLCLPLSWVYPLVGQALATLRAGGALIDLTSLPSVEAQRVGLSALEATCVMSVPSHLAELARVVLELPLEERPALRFLGAAGAPTSAHTVARLRQAFPSAELYNLYGLTEAGGRVAMGVLDDPAVTRGSVGRPLPGLRVVALSMEGQPLPAGEIGQLAVHSPGVMVGLLDSAEESARLIGPQGLLTGDLGYVTSDGEVILTGRSDDLVKVSGEFASPRELEALVSRIPGVGEVVVLATTLGEQGVRLLCFVAPERVTVGTLASGNLTARIRQELESLPPHRRPSRIVELETLPHLPGGKIDRLALRRMVELDDGGRGSTAKGRT